jgi:hypothetical protein
MSSDALGIELDGELPEGWTPLEVVVTVKCLNEKGEVQMDHFASHGLNSFEAWAMSQWTADTLRDGLRSGDED